MLFLEADEETLLDRYKETRRRHPLAPEGRIVDGIRAERELLAPLRERADVVMDTTDLTGAELRRRIAEELLGTEDARKLALTLLTFGFKNGPPRDADLTLDVRFLPNPHYVDELRPLTGLDEQVREYVESGTQAGEFYGRLLPLLEFLVPAYVAEGKSHLTIAIGCTGGRHRSVTVADRIRRDLAARDDVVVRVKHRDVELDEASGPRAGSGAPTSIVRGSSRPSPRIAGLGRAGHSISGLRKSYGDLEAVRGIDLEVERGEVFAFLGPNGAGKTTTVEILEGYRERTGGEVQVLGEDPESAGRAWRERIGIVLQSCSLDPYLTVRESLELYAGYYRRPRPVEETIALVGLEEKADDRAGKLSGGQQRRLDVGIALVGDPELLFLDEPTTGFDPSARRQAWDVIAGLRDLGKTVFLTTHYMDEAQRLADRVAIIAAGEIVAHGTPEDLGDRESQPRRRSATATRRRGGQRRDDDAGADAATPHRRGAGAGRGPRGPRSDPAHARGRLPRADRRRAEERARVSACRLRRCHQFRYDQKVFWRNPASVGFTVSSRSCCCSSSGPSSATDDRSARRHRHDTYYVPAIITLAIISATMQTLAMSLVIAREDGRLKRGRGTPMPLGLHRRPGRQLDRHRGADAGAARRDRRASLYGVEIPWDRLPAILLALASAPPPSPASASRSPPRSRPRTPPPRSSTSCCCRSTSSPASSSPRPAPDGVIHFADLFPIRHFFLAFFDAYLPGGGPALDWDNLADRRDLGGRRPAAGGPLLPLDPAR